MLENNDFEGDLTGEGGTFGSGFWFMPEPWTTQGVTYATGDNLVVTPATSYAPLSNVFVNNG